MTPEKVIELAKQVGISWDEVEDYSEYRVGISEFRAFTQLVRNETLDEAAKYCEKTAGVWLTPAQSDVTAKEIRSLKS